MKVHLEVESIRFRSGDWDHCLMCKAEGKQVEATHEVLINDGNSWMPVCLEHRDDYMKRYNGKKEWREKQK